VLTQPDHVELLSYAGQFVAIAVIAALPQHSTNKESSQIMAESAHPEAKAELLERMRSGRAAWDGLLAQVPAVVVTQPVLEGGWSVKDLIAHVAAYEQWTAVQIRAANEGRVPTSMELDGVAEIPAELAGWDADRQNASLYARYRDMPLDGVTAFATHAFADLTAAVEAVPEEEFGKQGAQAWLGGNTLLEIVPGNSYAHYEHHLDGLRAIVGQDAE
jgi:hypothetical protein